jgi:hypothetical protein
VVVRPTVQTNEERIMPDYVPTTDAGLLSWATNMSAQVTATPTAFGLTAGIATTLAGHVTTYSDTLEAATNPTTRGGSTVFAKDTARQTLVAYVRQVVGTIQGTPSVTAQQKYDLGITVRDRVPTPITPPAMAPDVLILSTSGRTVKIRMIDPANPTRRGKPLGVAGASVFSYVGAEAPAEVSAWKFEGNTTRTSVDVLFDAATAAGAKVWLTAFWFNPRAQSGPACPPVSTHIPGGSVQVAA